MRSGYLVRGQFPLLSKTHEWVQKKVMGLSAGRSKIFRLDYGHCRIYPTVIFGKNETEINIGKNYLNAYCTTHYKSREQSRKYGPTASMMIAEESQDKQRTSRSGRIGQNKTTLYFFGSSTPSSKQTRGPISFACGGA